MVKLPQLNEQDAAKLSRLIRDGQLLPVLNNTKWSELIGEMILAPEMKPQFRVRSVFGRPDFITEWDGEWHYHIHPVAELEWIELRAASNSWLIEVLGKHNIPYSDGHGIIRVWGYTRPGVQPSWV